MNTEDEYYPQWLARGVVLGEIPWEAGARTTMARFLAEFTLHDSCWISLVTDPAYEGAAVAVIRWDTFWTDGRVPFPGSVVAEWPILLIRFVRLDGLRFRGLERDIGGISRTISGAESSVAGDAARTEIADVFEGVVTLDHAPEVVVLCLDREKRLVPIPRVSPKSS